MIVRFCAMHKMSWFEKNLTGSPTGLHHFSSYVTCHRLLCLRRSLKDLAEPLDDECYVFLSEFFSVCPILYPEIVVYYQRISNQLIKGIEAAQKCSLGVIKRPCVIFIYFLELLIRDFGPNFYPDPKYRRNRNLCPCLIWLYVAWILSFCRWF